MNMNRVGNQIRLSIGWREEKTYFPDEPIMYRRYAMITPSHLNTTKDKASEYKLCPRVEYKLSKTHLDLVTYPGSISCVLTAGAPWSPPPRSSWPQWPSSSPWPPPPCPARARSPGGGCWCGPRDKSGWCHFHPSSVTILGYAALLLPPSKMMFYSMLTHLAVTKCDTFRSDARFSYFSCETFKITHNFPLLVIPETKEKKCEKGSFKSSKHQEKMGLLGNASYWNKDSFEGIDKWWNRFIPRSDPCNKWVVVRANYFPSGAHFISISTETKTDDNDDADDHNISPHFFPVKIQCFWLLALNV